MRTWIEDARKTRDILKNESEARRKQQAEEREPLRVRLEKLIAELPPERAAAGLPMQFFVEQTTARWRGQHANNRDVGTALRAMGWRRGRCWTGDQDGYNRLWYPPTDKTAETPQKAPHTSTAAVNEPTLTDPLAELFSA